jgi:drug/metabolite transporter (DMT)-like permease
MKKTFLYGSLLLTQCLLWGIGNPIMKIGLEVVPPFLCLAIRFILAFLIFLLFFGRKVFSNLRVGHLAAYLTISACTAASFIFSAFALIYTTATNTGFLMGTAVIFTPFLSYFILKARIDKRHILHIVIVTFGLYLLCSGGGSLTFGIGEVFALLCAITGAGMLVFSSKYLQEIDPLVISVMQTGFTGLFCLILTLLFEGIPDLSAIPMVGWGVIAYLAVGCTCIAYLFQNTALRNVPATFVALSFCSEPIFTVAASYWILGEVLSTKGIVGAALILVSIIMASLFPEEKTEALPTLSLRADLET